MKQPGFRYCPRCASKGLIKVQYHSGEAFDVAICDCAAGQFWRMVGEAAIRQRMGVPASCQVALREHFEGETLTAPPAAETFVAAGKTAKRAKL